MNLTFLPRAWEDYVHWQTADRKLLGRLNAILADMRRSPFAGVGKPEPLRQNWAGWWSRRLNEEHRVVYRVIGTGAEQRLEVAQCRFHY